MVKVEERAVGSVPISVIRQYFVSGGTIRCILLILIYACAQTLRILSDWWIGIWAVD